MVHTLSSPITTVSTPSSKTPKCEIIHKDAISALSRAKTEECKDMIKEIVCLSQDDKLYNTSIINSCPRGRNPAKQFKAIPYTEGVGPLPRVVFLLSVHGRAVRQIKRLFKAIYHSHHYYYIHVDFVSVYICVYICLCVHVYVSVYITTYVYKCIHVCTCLCVCVHVCVYITTYVCIYVYMCIHICLYVSIYLFI